MKTIKFILMLCLVLVNILFGNLLFAQSIINTLGPGGVFTIKDASTTFFSLSQSTGQLNLYKTLALENTTSSTTGVIYKGNERFLHNYGADNTFLGIVAGNFTMTGSSNTAIGQSSFFFNNTGSYNTAIGRSSLNSNSTGFYNSAIGSYSLFNNTSGGYNTAVGFQSLFYNNGNSNTAMGYNCMYNNNTGFENTAVGMSSLFWGNGSYNTAIGHSSLNWNYADYNTAVGWRSLYSNTYGNQNTAVGNLALTANNNGTGNTAMGYNSLAQNTTGSQNTAVGHHSMVSNTGNYNTALGYNSGSTITSGYNLTCIGIDAAPTSPTAGNQVTLGNIYVSSLRCNVTTITSLSDMRDKKNITDLSLGLDFIAKLKPRQFNWDKREWYDDNVSDGSKMSNEPTAGFIAQELDDAQTSQNAEWLNLVLKDNPEKWEATPGNIMPIMVKAIQELKAENDMLKEKLVKMEEFQNMLASEIKKLKDSEIESSKVSVVTSK